MRIGIVFHKDPFAAVTSIDLVRLRAFAFSLLERGFHVRIVAPAKRPGRLDDRVDVIPARDLDRHGDFDLLKTSYHQSIRLIGNFSGPVVSRIVRVVDEKLPERDEAVRSELLECQEIIRRRATALSLNNRENEERWRRFYGPEPPIVLVPTGCPARIPPEGPNPYGEGARVMLFLGSIAAPRMLEMLNRGARALEGRCSVHLVGRNKTGMYGGDAASALDSLIVDHGEISADRIWDYIRHARIGLALATGPHPFDNDVSKVLDYLRGGLPVLSEEPIVNNDLVRRTGYGRIFAHGDIDDFAAGALELLENPRPDKRDRVMEYMAREQSWDRRGDIYANLFTMIAEGRIRSSFASPIAREKPEPPRR